jgi:hypothetical protein
MGTLAHFATCVILPPEYLLVFETQRWQGADGVTTAKKARGDFDWKMLRKNTCFP